VTDTTDKETNERTNERTNEQTDGRTDGRRDASRLFVRPSVSQMEFDNNEQVLILPITIFTWRKLIKQSLKLFYSAPKS